MLDSLIVAYVQFLIMLIESQELLSQEVRCLCSKTTTDLLEWTIPKTMDASLLHFYCIRKKIHTLYRNVCMLYRNVYPLYIQHIHTPQVHTSTTGIVIHYIRWGCQFPNSQEIHCFKCEFCVWFAWFWLARLLQQHNPGMKQDLPVCRLVQKDTKTVQTNGTMLNHCG